MLLAIESASDTPGVALAEGGTVVAERTWATQQNHSRELLPAVERLLAEAGRGKNDVTAVAVDIGPGGYAALRVGVSIAKALAHALRVPLAGLCRLDLDAWLVRGEAGGARIVALHRAGRGEFAWAAYRLGEREWSEDTPPRLVKASDLHGILDRADIVTGDVDDAVADDLAEAGILVAHPPLHRVHALAELGARRLAAGRADDPTALVPLYLRAPAIGPQG